MRSVMPIRAAKTGYIVASLLYCLLGIALVLWPAVAIDIKAIAIAIVMMIFGIVKVTGYFTRDLYRLAFQHDLAFGILLIALGITILIGPKKILESLCVILGIAGLGDGLLKVQTALDARRFGLESWIKILVSAIAVCGVGIILIFMPGKSALVVTKVTGLVLFAQGLMNLITGVFAVKVVRNQRNDVIDNTEQFDNKWRQI